MEKRKQASRTPNASRNTTARSMSERQGVRGLPNLAAAFGVREACFRFGLSHASIGPDTSTAFSLPPASHQHSCPTPSLHVRDCTSLQFFGPESVVGLSDFQTFAVTPLP